MAFINKVRRTVSQAIAGTLEADAAASKQQKHKAGGGAGGRTAAGGRGGGAGGAGGVQCAQAMLGELMALLMRPELTPEEKAEEQAFKDGHVHGMKPGVPAPPKKEKLHWVKCRFEENSADYLPQVFLDATAADRASGKAGAAAGRKAEAVAVPAGYVGVSLLCSHDFNVASQMPAGMFMTSREECESGRHAWCVMCGCVGVWVCVGMCVYTLCVSVRVLC